MSSRRGHLEDDFQIQVADYLRWQYPQLFWWHTPNGGKRNPREGARLKRMGVLPGVADIQMRWVDKETGKPCSGSIELKVGKNTQQDTQKLFQQQWQHTGGQYAVCYTLDEVIAVLRDWRVPGITRCPTVYAEGAVIEKYTAKPHAKQERV